MNVQTLKIHNGVKDLLFLLHFREDLAYTSCINNDQRWLSPLPQLEIEIPFLSSQISLDFD